MIALIMDKEKLKSESALLKDQIRKQQLGLRSVLGHRLIDLYAHKIHAAITSLPEWTACERPGLYASLPKEISTFALISNALGAGKTPLLPAITDKKNRKMEFYPVRDLASLKKGVWGILEPDQGETAQVPDLIILPGVAFSLEGERIGYGGGFYDRYLASHNPVAVRIGLAFSFQIFGKLPHSETDMPVNALCCEKGFAWL